MNLIIRASSIVTISGLLNGCSLIILSILTAPSDPTPTFDIEAKEAVCVVDGVPVKIIANFQTSRISTIASASYDRESKQRVINMSSVALNEYPANVSEFIFYHECAHHSLDHISTSDELPQPKMLWSSEMVREETDADCAAAKSFTENNPSPDAKIGLMISLANVIGDDRKRLTNIRNCLKI